jgi:hypothetical protein
MLNKNKNNVAKPTNQNDGLFRVGDDLIIKHKLPPSRFFGLDIIWMRHLKSWKVWKL